MAGVRTFNMCMNTNYLNDVGIKGLAINVNDGKSQRIICSCGHVGTETLALIAATQTFSLSLPIDGIKPLVPSM